MKQVLVDPISVNTVLIEGGDLRRLLLLLGLASSAAIAVSMVG